ACSPWRRLAERARKIVREETFHAAFAADALSRIARPSAEARAALDAELDLAEQCSEREALEAALADAAGAGLVPLSALDAFDAHVSAALAALRRGAVPQESTLRCPRCGSASVRMLALYGSLLMTSQYRCSCGELFDAIRFSDDGLETAARET
ncbi:MAG: hypothetical protein M3N49_13790, partial [Candidatus Eremiobacteraeota bacterium]|nr:hypothetical protein [Candidatus Eremiobacteraeota bacterium]